MPNSSKSKGELIALRHKCSILRNLGYKNKDIQEIVQMSEKFVSKWWKKDENDIFNFYEEHRIGRKRKLNEDAKQVINDSLGKFRMSTRKLSKQLSINGIQNVSKSTIHRYLKNEAHAYPKKIQKIARKPRNWREKRI